jgi:uncharacterized protein
MSSADDPRLTPEPEPEAGSAGSSPDPDSLTAPRLDSPILSYESSPGAGAGSSGEILPQGIPPETPGTGHSRQFLDPDLRVPWGWIDLLLLVIVWIGATVLSTMLLVTFVAAHGVPFSEVQHSPRYLGFFAVADQLIVYVVVFLYLWIQARLRFNAPFWTTMGWRRFDNDRWPRPIIYLGLIALGFVLAAAVELVSLEFPAKTKLPIENFLENRQAALALIAMSVLLAPVVEETVFRGYLYPVVARSFGVFAGIIGTGTVFGLLHAEQLWGGWVQIALLVGVGIVFTWARAAKRTVLASYVLHVSYNLLVASSGFRSLVHH